MRDDFGNYFAWLIENDDTTMPPEYAIRRHMGVLQWTTDAYKALHFCRKCDAESFCIGNLCVRHEFSDSPGPVLHRPKPTLEALRAADGIDRTGLRLP